MKQDLETLIKVYIDNAVIQGESTLNGDYKTGNKAVKKVTKIYKLMEQDNQLAIQMLDVLFKDNHINVRIWAAAHALGLKIKISEAIAILEEISNKEEGGILEFNAEMSLKIYKERGYLKFY